MLELRVTTRNFYEVKNLKPKRVEKTGGAVWLGS